MLRSPQVYSMLLGDLSRPRKTGERSHRRSHVWQIWKSLICNCNHTTFLLPLKERNHDQRRQSQHLWLQNQTNVKSRATHQALLCSVWMEDASLWNILSWRVFSSESGTLNQTTGCLVLYCQAELQIRACLLRFTKAVAEKADLLFLPFDEVCHGLMYLGQAVRLESFVLLFCGENMKIRVSRCQLWTNVFIGVVTSILLNCRAWCLFIKLCSSHLVLYRITKSVKMQEKNSAFSAVIKPNISDWLLHL